MTTRLYKRKYHWRQKPDGSLPKGYSRLLSRTEVLTIRSVYRKGKKPTIGQLTQVFDINRSSIFKIIKGLSYKDIPGIPTLI